MKRSIRSSSPLFEQKRSLRREKERQTASLLPEYIKESDSAIIEKLLNLSEFKNAETVFLYYSVGREVSTTALIEKLLDEGRSTALPVSGNNGAISFYPVIGKDTLRPGKFGIPEPPVTREVRPEQKTLSLFRHCAATDTETVSATERGTMTATLRIRRRSACAFAERRCSKKSCRPRIPTLRYRSF